MKVPAAVVDVGVAEGVVLALADGVAVGVGLAVVAAGAQTQPPRRSAARSSPSTRTASARHARYFRNHSIVATQAFWAAAAL